MSRQNPQRLTIIAADCCGVFHDEDVQRSDGASRVDYLTAALKRLAELEQRFGRGTHVAVIDHDAVDIDCNGELTDMDLEDWENEDGVIA